MKFLTEYPNWREFTLRLPRTGLRCRKEPTALERFYSLQMMQGGTEALQSASQQYARWVAANCNWWRS